MSRETRICYHVKVFLVNLGTENNANMIELSVCKALSVLSN